MTKREIREAYPDLPPVLNLDEAADVARLAPSTVKRRVHEGHFRDSVKPGKPLRFWRDRFVQEFMSG